MDKALFLIVFATPRRRGAAVVTDGGLEEISEACEQARRRGNPVVDHSGFELDPEQFVTAFDEAVMRIPPADKASRSRRLERLPHFRRRLAQLIASQGGNFWLLQAAALRPDRSSTPLVGPKPFVVQESLIRSLCDARENYPNLAHVPSHSASRLREVRQRRRSGTIRRLAKAKRALRSLRSVNLPRMESKGWYLMLKSNRDPKEKSPADLTGARFLTVHGYEFDMLRGDAALIAHEMIQAAHCPIDRPAIVAWLTKLLVKPHIAPHHEALRSFVLDELDEIADRAESGALIEEIDPRTDRRGVDEAKAIFASVFAPK